MKKEILFSGLFVVVLSGFLFSVVMDGDLGPDDLSRYKGIAWAEIPGECLGFREDVCGLFGCMVGGCWCDDSSPSSPILYEPAGVMLRGEGRWLLWLKSF
ncbi:MAG: hypothetical protein KAU03_05070 [Candidatus Altiarchaeales archaeon]|nr:hypothetical protein [Candidatus Altiarchaeales archaeon]